MRIFTFTWFIQNFSYSWHKETQCLQSPTFFIEIIQKTSWNLELYPRGIDDPYNISLLLKRSDKCNGAEKVTFHCELSILDANGEALKSIEIEVNSGFENDELFGCLYFYERPEHNLINRGFTLDVLRVRCKMWMDEEGVDEDVLCYAKTQIGLEKISFIKTIENFSSLEPNRKIPFEVTPVSEEEFKLSGNVYIKREPFSEDQVILEICRFGDESQNLHLITCQIFTLNSTGNEEECGKIDIREDICRESTLSAPLYLSKRNLLNKKDECLSNNKLTLRCEITLISTQMELLGIDETFYNPHLIPSLKEKIRSKYFSPLTLEPKSVTDDLRSLYKDGILSDIQIETANKTFFAHKIVLCSRSSVFRSMLTTDMTEKANNIVKIDDLDDITMDQFLLFLYTDILEDHRWESWSKLYYAADKYDVQRLKDLCTSFLVTGCNEGNMSDILILADRYQDSNLKSDVDKFICNSDKQMF